MSGCDHEPYNSWLELVETQARKYRYITNPFGRRAYRIPYKSVRRWLYDSTISDLTKKVLIAGPKPARFNTVEGWLEYHKPAQRKEAEKLAKELLHV